MQRTLKDQIRELIDVATERGLDDAAAVLRRWDERMIVFEFGGPSERFDWVDEVFFRDLRRQESEEAGESRTTKLDLGAFNSLLAEAVAELRVTSRDQIQFVETFWRQLPNAPLDIPSTIELVSANEMVRSVAALNGRFTTHELLRAIESLEQFSRAGDSVVDTRHVYFEALAPEQNHPGRYLTCWGS